MIVKYTNYRYGTHETEDALPYYLSRVLTNEERDSGELENIKASIDRTARFIGELMEKLASKGLIQPEEIKEMLPNCSYTTVHEVKHSQP